MVVCPEECYFSAKEEICQMSRSYRQNFTATGLLVLFLLVSAFLVQSPLRADAQEFRDPRSSGALPIFRLDYGDPVHWVNKNAVKLIGSAGDFEQIRNRVVAHLSSACALGHFNQRKIKRYFLVAKTDRKGAHLPAERVIVLGYAHGRGVNLHDPKGLAREDQYYLFRYDRTGKCQVFLGG